MPPGPLQEEHAAMALESKCPDGGSARGSELWRGREKDVREWEDPLRMISMPGCHKGGIEESFREQMAIRLCPGVGVPSPQELTGGWSGRMKDQEYIHTNGKWDVRCLAAS